jgi:hypothetical protein
LVDGTVTTKTSPVQIGADNDWVTVSTQFSHILATKSNGTLWTWGWNGYGQLGDGTTTDRNIPIQIGAENNWTGVSAGNSHSIAVHSNGTFCATGQGTAGQLGNGTSTNSSVFVCDATSVILPLSLSDFSGQLSNNNALLQWKTDNEVNTSMFEIERSVDGRNYVSIGTKAANNSSGIHQYNFTDPFIRSLNATVVYYRLKQIDIDGRFTYSRIIALPVNSNKAIVILYPNPANTELNISMSNSETEKIKYQLIDANGRILKEGVKQLSAGANSLSIDVNKLSSGVYYLMINGNIIHKQLQFVKE